jgi:hypothetical protein
VTGRADAAALAFRITAMTDRLNRIKAGGGDAGVLAAGLAGALAAADQWLAETATGNTLGELRFTRAQAASELLGAIEASLAEVTP